MTKERTYGTPQLNLRVPSEHQDRVRKVVALLRTNEGFQARLDELIATASIPTIPSFLSEVVDRIDRLEAALLAQTEMVDSAASKAPDVKDSADSGSVGKRGEPVTDAEWKKIRDAIRGDPEMSNQQIANLVGRPTGKDTVRNIRNAMKAASGRGMAAATW